MRIAICIATYRRPQGLKRLLDSLAQLTFVQSAAPHIRLIVVDNDKHGSACAVVDAARASLAWPVVYAIEPRRGISMVRNRAVALAEEEDFLAFIDDDEVASPHWLDEHLVVQRQSHARVSAGPVRSHFEASPPAWMQNGDFFHPRPPMRDGKPLYTGLGNVLIAKACFPAGQPPFVEAFALTGGEDLYLFLQLQQRNEPVAWAEQAEVTEYIPPSRMTMQWLIRRAYRGGNCFTLCMRRLGRSPFWWLSRLVKGVGRVGQGALHLLPALLRGKRELAQSILTISRGCGTLAGVIGVPYEEYRRIHGR